MRSFAKVALSIALFGALGGCSSLVNSPPTVGPNYTTVPCAENCGSDPHCLSSCTPAGNNPPPAALMGTSH
jgi:hypothetical protein